MQNMIFAANARTHKAAFLRKENGFCIACSFQDKLTVLFGMVS